MEKKVTAQGPKKRPSYTVTLPIEWVKRQKVDKKKAIDLQMVANKVIISADAKQQERLMLSGEEYKDCTEKILQCIYRVGWDEIRIDVENPQIASRLMETCEKWLMGYEILEQKKDYLVIKDVTQESAEDFNSILRRIFLLVIELSESADEIQRKNFEKNIKRLINYCQRILMKKGHGEFNKVPLYYLLLDRIEKLADEFSWLLTLEMDASARQRRKELAFLLRKGYELHYSFDAAEYAKHQYRTYILKNEMKRSDKMKMQTIHLHNIARQLNSMYGDIFSLQHSTKL